MGHYFKIHGALQDLRIAAITGRKDLIEEANEQLTKAVRKACGLE